MAAGRGRPLERLHRLVEPREDVRLAVRLDPGDLALRGRRSRRAAAVWTTQWAASLKATTPSSSRAVMRRRRPQDRLLADVDLLDAGDAGRRPCRRLNVLQWQASIEPDLSMTTTSATSGCFWRSRTPMSTGSVSSSGVFCVAAGAVALRPADHHEPLAEVADVRPGARPAGRSIRRSRGTSTRTTLSYVGEAGEVARAAPRGSIVSTCWRSVLSAATSSAATSSSPARTSDPRLALDDRVRVGPVVLAERVARRPRRRPGTCGSPASVGLTSNVTRCRAGRRGRPAASATSAPSANRRTVAGLGDGRADRRPIASIDSPSRAVDGVVSRSTRTSSTPPSPIAPRLDLDPAGRRERRLGLARRRSCRCRRERRTIRFWASSGKSAEASRSAAPMSVARLDRRRGDPVDLARAPTGSRSTSASLPNATIPATSPSRHRRRASRAGTRGRPRGPALPTESDRSTTKTVASRSTGRTSWNPASASDERGQQDATGRRARPAGGPTPDPPPRRRGAGRSSARAPGSAGAARAARRTRCPSGARRPSAPAAEPRRRAPRRSRG